MAQLTKERDHLFETIRTYLLLFETTRQLINEMQGSVHFPFLVFYSETAHVKIVLCLALCVYRVLFNKLSSARVLIGSQLSSIEVAEHSFPVPMPNSPLLLNYL